MLSNFISLRLYNFVHCFSEASLLPYATNV
jgi:hypothetical protein